MNARYLYILLLILGVAAAGCAASKKENGAIPEPERPAKQDSFLVHLLAQYPQYFDTLLQQNDTWGIQIVYTQIDRNRYNKPRFHPLF